MNSRSNGVPAEVAGALAILGGAGAVLNTLRIRRRSKLMERGRLRILAHAGGGGIAGARAIAQARAKRIAEVEKEIRHYDELIRSVETL